MHPNTYLKTFWRLKLKPQVFVAMSFAAQYQKRFDEVIAPAIRAIQINGVHLQTFRVDLSKSGDSILTEINDGIAHSHLVLADVSTAGRDAVTGYPYRNGNVMYEVGIALASRLPHEVLLIRDDNDKFLFDVSTIPHRRIDFTDHVAAQEILQEELQGRIREGNHVRDARIQIALAALTGGELACLKFIASKPKGHCWGWPNQGDTVGVVSIPRLLDKQLIRVVAQFENDVPAYVATELGYVTAKMVAAGLPTVAKETAEQIESESVDV